MKQSKPSFDVIDQLGSLRRYARSLTRDGADAEDLVHDALVRAYERRDTFRSSGSLRTWLLSILHNTFIDGARSRRAEAKRVGQASDMADSRIEAPQEHSVRLAQVREAFLDLAEEQRAALRIVAMEGLSCQEVGVHTRHPARNTDVTYRSGTGRTLRNGGRTGGEALTYGSAPVVHQLASASLIDEYRLMVTQPEGRNAECSLRCRFSTAMRSSGQNRTQAPFVVRSLQAPC